MLAKPLRTLLSVVVPLLAVAACEREPDTTVLLDQTTVWSDCDPATDFGRYATYYLPDSILRIGAGDRPLYRTGDGARRVVGAFAWNLGLRGFERSPRRDAADLGVQLSYVERTEYFVGSDARCWWWYYPYYWSPGYWGDWDGWHYPYPVAYLYTAGVLLAEMVDLTAAGTGARRLPVVWSCCIGGLRSPSAERNVRRAVEAVAEAFEESPALTRRPADRNTQRP